MATIQPGLFGYDPTQLQQAEQQRWATMYGQSGSPYEKIGLALGQLGTAGVKGLFDIQDPALVANKEATSIAAQFNLNTAAGLKDYTAALQQRAQETGNPQLAAIVPRAAAEYQKAALAEATIADKLEKKTDAPDVAAKRVRYDELVAKYGQQAGAKAFLDELQASKEKVAKAGVAPTVKAAGSISGVVNEYQKTVQPYTDKIDAADNVIASLNEASGNNSSPAFNSARVALARASGDKTLSRRDIEEAGGDASLAGKILNTGSELFTGVPTKETMRDMARAANVLKKVSQMKKDAITMQQRDIAEGEFGMDKNKLDRQFPLSPKAGGKSSAPEVKTLNWNDFAAPKK